MSDNKQLDSFRNHDGSTSYAGQSNAGQWEGNTFNTPSQQQSWESADAYNQRINSFNWTKNNNSGS